MTRVLAIETSCDETSVAIVKNRQVLSNIVKSQINIHSFYGGVAANSGLRWHLSRAAGSHNLQVLFPSLKFCTDNAAMIGCAAADHLSRGHISSLNLGANSRMAIKDVMDLYKFHMVNY